MHTALGTKRCVLASCCCCNKLSQVQWLKITRVYSLTVLEVRSLKRIGMAGSFQRLQGGIHFFAFSSALPVKCHYQLSGPEFEQTLGDSEGQGSLACCSPWGHKESDTTEQLHFHFSLSCIGGHGNPLQCSCLENPRDRGAW